MALQDITKIPAPRTPIADETSGEVTPAWYRFFYTIFTLSGSGGDGGISVNRGGTGQTSYTDGQLLIGNSVGNTLDKNTLTPGTGIGVTNGNGTIAVANTGVLSNIAGAGISVDQATGNVTIGNTGVLSVIAGAGISVSSPTGNVTLANTGVLSVSGGTTGLTPAVATTGAIVLAGTLVTSNGGTGAAGTLTGYVKGAGVAAMTASATIPNTDITGLGTMSTQNVGITATITTAALTALGAQGSMTFVNGILTAQTQAT